MQAMDEGLLNESFRSELGVFILHVNLSAQQAAGNRQWMHT